MYCSPNTVQVIKSRRMRWVWQWIKLWTGKCY
jgi:hypothetical protein